MEISVTQTLIITISVILFITVLTLIILNRRKFIKNEADILDPGWQFYATPTTLDAPGTVFRLDKNNRKYNVDTLDIPITKGKIATGRIVKQGLISMGVISSLLGLGKILIAKGKKVETLEFEMNDSIEEITSDVDADKIIDSFLEKLPFKLDNRYFIIRQARLAKSMKYILSEQISNNFKGGIQGIQKTKVDGMITKNDKDEFELDQNFDEHMRIMFLPEEIVQISAGLVGVKPQLGLKQVTEEITWEE